MFAQARLKELAEARRLLVMQSDIHRGLIRLEIASWTGSLDGLDSVRAKIAGHPRLASLGAVLSGLLLMRYRRALVRWTFLGLMSWRLLRRFVGAKFGSPP